MDGAKGRVVGWGHGLMGRRRDDQGVRGAPPHGGEDPTAPALWDRLLLSSLLLPSRWWVLREDRTGGREETAGRAGPMTQLAWVGVGAWRADLRARVQQVRGPMQTRPIAEAPDPARFVP